MKYFKTSLLFGPLTKEKKKKQKPQMSLLPSFFKI